MKAILPTFCGAKTRRGGRCVAYAVAGRKRCRMHGGNSLAWFASPRYKHGRFSKYGTAAAVAAQAREARKRARFLRAVLRKVEALEESRGRELSGAEFLLFVRQLSHEHERELAARRERYAGAPADKQ